MPTYKKQYYFSQQMYYLLSYIIKKTNSLRAHFRPQVFFRYLTNSDKMCNCISIINFSKSEFFQLNFLEWTFVIIESLSWKKNSEETEWWGGDAIREASKRIRFQSNDYRPSVHGILENHCPRQRRVE